ncbi:MAG: hypothetical protein PVG20_01760 [Thioalkalispiraceae bacterium]
MNELVIIIFALVAAIGLSLLFFGLLAAIVTAAGHNKYWGIASIILPPVAIVYCLLNPEQAKYPLKLLATGLVTIIALLIISQILLQLKLL